jgi:hypothetical protein
MKKKLVLHPVEVLEQNLRPAPQDARKNSAPPAASPGGFMAP